MNDTKISITLWGNYYQKEKWIEWYEDMKNISSKLHYSFSHISIQSPSFSDKKILTIARKEKAILSNLKKGEEPSSMSLYSLPKNFEIAMFDYDLLCARRESYISIVLKESDYNSEIEDFVLSIIKEYINYDIGEVYSTNISELPMLYAETRNSDNLETYKLIKNI